MSGHLRKIFPGPIYGKFEDPDVLHGCRVNTCPLDREKIQGYAVQYSYCAGSGDLGVFFPFFLGGKEGGLAHFMGG